MKKVDEEINIDMNLETDNVKSHNALYFVAGLGIMIAIYLVFNYASVEKTMGVVQKIFYFHVGVAWNAFLAFFIVFIFSVLYLITKKRVYDVYAASSATIGVMFTTLVLLTGPIWAKSAWNIWWNWEPRLTSTLILWFIYVAYMMIRLTDGAWDKKAKLCAVFGIIGFIDVPIIYFSIKWWNSKFHPQVLGNASGGLESNMLLTLIFTAVAMSVFYIVLLQKAVKIEKSIIVLQGIKDKMMN